MPGIADRIISFINSPKHVPVLAGFSVGIYVLLFYYARNYSLANSPEQFLFFSAYYIALPVLVLYIGYKLLGASRWKRYQSNFLFLGVVSFLAFYLLQLMQIGVIKRVYFVGIIVIAALLSFKIAKYYKLVTLLLLLLSAFNLFEVGKILIIKQQASDDWKKQPDDIANIVFKERPNIYFIQPDGYANAGNLKSELYNFDNSEFNSFLDTTGFKIYKDFRSNYFSTLLSNSSAFSMKHHYSAPYIEKYGARDVIIGDNAVLDILKRNKYQTYFYTERPYLLINRPTMGFDHSNFNYSEMSYFMDGWSSYRNYFNELTNTISNNTKAGNFYFIESFDPGHIHNYEQHSQGVEGERARYLRKLKRANVFLTKLVTHINKNDPDAIVIIGADHGGYVGFAYSGQAEYPVNDSALINSMFGAHLSIKWNSPRFTEYDANLKSSVNLFRTVFSYLAHDKKYLNFSQDNSSYVRLKQPRELYKYIDDKGNIKFEKADDVQD